MSYQKMGPRFFVLLFLAFSRLHSDVYIWDFGGVLGDCQHGAGQIFSSYSTFNKITGYCSLITLLAKFEVQHPFSNPFAHFKEFFLSTYLQALTNVIDPLTQKPYQSTTSYDIYSDDGITPLPPLLKDLMLGNIGYDQARELWYNSNQPDFLNKVFEFNFNAERFTNSLILLPCADLLRQCAQQINPDGSKKNCCIVLSNMDAAVVAKLKEKFIDTITPCINHWIFSGEVHCAKPNKEIYDLCYAYIQTLPETVRQKIYFIDDQKVNRDAAQPCIPGIICAHPDDAAQVLKEGNVLSVA